MKLEGRKAIVTGAAKGMGAAITTTLAREGADIVLTARDIPPLVEVAAEVRSMGRESWVVGCDVTDDQEVREMVAKAIEVFEGRIDILVNVAGVTGPIETPVQDIDVDDFDYVVTANERGTFLPIKYVVPAMIAQKEGKIVNISGTSGLRGYAMRTAYSASKWAVRGITRTVALELGSTTSTSTRCAPASWTARGCRSSAGRRRGFGAGPRRRSTKSTSRTWR